jgi:adenine-specific DNA methylase
LLFDLEKKRSNCSKALNKASEKEEMVGKLVDLEKMKKQVEDNLNRKAN